jgi:hypothetical protein
LAKVPGLDAILKSANMIQQIQSTPGLQKIPGIAGMLPELAKIPGVGKIIPDLSKIKGLDQIITATTKVTDVLN